MRFKEDLRVTMLVNKNEDHLWTNSYWRRVQKYRVFRKEFYGFPRICEDVAYVRSRRPLKRAVIKEILDLSLKN